MKIAQMFMVYCVDNDKLQQFFFFPCGCTARLDPWTFSVHGFHQSLFDAKAGWESDYRETFTSTGTRNILHRLRIADLTVRIGELQDCAKKDKKRPVTVARAKLKRHGDKLLAFLLRSHIFFLFVQSCQFAMLGDVCKKPLLYYMREWKCAFQ
jgi:hypothetical protein